MGNFFITFWGGGGGGGGGGVFPNFPVILIQNAFFSNFYLKGESKC